MADFFVSAAALPFAGRAEFDPMGGFVIEDSRGNGV